MAIERLSPGTHQNDDRRFIVIVLLIELAAILILCSFFFHDRLEDSYITFRYAKHLAQGYGIGAWNTTGEKVEGFSSPGMMLILAAAGSIGLDIEISSKIIGILSFSALCMLLLYLAYFKPQAIIKHISPQTLILASMLVTLYLPVAWYAGSGMETVVFALLTTSCLLISFGLIDKAVFVVPCFLTAIFRPEGIPFVLLLFLWHIYLNYRDKPRRNKVVLNLALFLTLIIIMFVIRFLIFRDFLPNTYYAKLYGGGWNHIVFGLRDIYHWALTNPIWLAAFMIVLLSEIRSYVKNNRLFNPLIALLLVVQLAALGYNVLIGGDNPAAFPFWRHQIHIIAIEALLVGLAVQLIIPRLKSLQIVAIILIALFGNFRVFDIYESRLISDLKKGLADWPRFAIDPPLKYDTWLKEFVTPHTTIACANAGELPFVVDAIHIDLLGLNDRYIARHGQFDPDGPVDSKTDMDYVLSQRPDIISLMYAKFVKEGRDKYHQARFRKKLIWGLIENKIFQDEYLFLWNGPYENFERALFLHKAYWENHPLRDSLICIPVIETGICR